MTEWKGTLKGTEDTYPHLSSVRDRFKENDDIVHAAICDAALSLISDQALAIHRLRESMRILACLNPNIENDVDNPWLVAHQVCEHVKERIEELEKRGAELEKVLTKADDKMERLEQYMDRVQNLIAFFHVDIRVAVCKDKK
jgi:hypothetical protein